MHFEVSNFHIVQRITKFQRSTLMKRTVKYGHIQLNCINELDLSLSPSLCIKHLTRKWHSICTFTNKDNPLQLNNENITIILRSKREGQSARMRETWHTAGTDKPCSHPSAQSSACMLSRHGCLKPHA